MPDGFLTVTAQRFKKKTIKLVLTGAVLFFIAAVTAYGVKPENQNEIIVLVPVNVVNLPADLAISDLSVETVKTHIIGIKKTVSVPVFNLDLSDADAGELIFTITPEKITAPKGFTVIRTDPGRLKIILEKKVTKTVPVELQFSCVPAKGYTLGKSTISPSSITLSGPVSVMSNLSSVLTRPVEISGASRSFKKEVVPDLDRYMIMGNAESRFIANINITDNIIEKKISGIAVTAVNPKKIIHITPKTADISICGPENKIGRLVEGDDIRIEIDTSGLSGGIYIRHATVLLPVDFTLVSVKPEIFTINVK